MSNQEPFIIINGESLSNLINLDVLYIIIFFCIIYILVDLIQFQIRLIKKQKKLRIDNKKQLFYNTKYKEAKTPEDFEKLKNWMNKNRGSFYYG